MKIKSADGIGCINIEYATEFKGYFGFAVEAHVSIGHGLFEARNSEVQFLNLAAFVAEFDRFILDRGLSPRLEGTYDTYLAFCALGRTIILRFRLGDSFYGQRTVNFHQYGEFTVDQESLINLLAGFRKLMTGQQSALEAD